MKNNKKEGTFIKILKFIKNVILILLLLIAFAIVISEPVDDLTLKIIILKAVSVTYIYLLAKANGCIK